MCFFHNLYYIYFSLSLGNFSTLTCYFGWLLFCNKKYFYHFFLLVFYFISDLFQLMKTEAVFVNNNNTGHNVKI